MANMSVNQRTQFERADLAVPSTGVRVRNRKAVIGFTALAVLVLGALCYATVVAIDGWAQAVVLAVIALTAVGAMIALDPLRRG
jgi:ABC-type Co2+ transport system permease subunit